MPPPMTACCVCGKSVLRSQTYATGEKGGDGAPLRACKEHEGIVEKAEELKKLSIEKNRQTVERHDGGKEAPDGAFNSLGELFKFQRWADLHCWCCGDKVIGLQDFYGLQLLAVEKLRLLGEYNPFSPEILKILRKFMKENGYTSIGHRFPLDEEQRKKYTEWSARIHPKCRPVVDLGNVIQMCFSCQERTGIKFDMRANMPEVSMEQMYMIGAAYQGSEAQQNLREVAKQSIVNDLRKSVEGN